MQVKYLPLIKVLFENEDWITAKNLSGQLDISLRTVKSYVSELNNGYPGMIISSAHGYKLDTQIASTALKETKLSIPQTARERCAYIINRIIRCGHNEQSLTSYDLCEELFISPTTLRSSFPRIRKMLSDFDLILQVSSDKMSIVGSERNKRKIISHLIYNEANENFVNLETIQKAFPNINIDFIRNTIQDVLSANQYFINDYSLSNFVLHIAIAVDRILTSSNDERLLEKVNETITLGNHEHRICLDLISRLEDRFNIKFTEVEAQELSLLLVSRATALKYQSITMDNLKEYVGSECLDIVHEIVEDINAFLYLNLNEPEFLIRFSLHIKNLLIRARNEKFNRNPMGNTIKSTCPLIYEHAVFCSEIIKKRTGLTINDDEIGYIAFHLGSTFETQRELASKTSAIILCPTYYNMGTRLMDTIRERFSSEMLVTNVIQTESELDNIARADLLISTVPLNNIHDIVSIQVQPFLSEANIQVIRRRLDEINLDKKRIQFSQNLKHIFTPELFEYGRRLKSKEEVIRYMTDKLFSLGYVDDTFYQEVLEREKMSSTGFGNFAIPHALHMNAKKTGMYFYISESPIEWDESMVNLIIMLCFRRDERYIFNQIFEPLTMMLTDSTIYNTVLKIKEYNELVEFIVHHFK